MVAILHLSRVGYPTAESGHNDISLETTIKTSRESDAEGELIGEGREVQF